MIMISNMTNCPPIPSHPRHPASDYDPGTAHRRLRRTTLPAGMGSMFYQTTHTSPLPSFLFFISYYCFGTGYAVVWFTTLPILTRFSAPSPVCRLLQLGGRGSFICGVESVHKCCYCYPLWKSMQKTCLLPLAVLFLYGLSLFSF